MWLSCSKPFCEYTKLTQNLTSLKARHLEIWTLLTCPALKLATFSTGTLLCRHITCLLFLGYTRLSLACSCPHALHILSLLSGSLPFLLCQSHSSYSPSKSRWYFLQKAFFELLSPQDGGFVEEASGVPQPFIHSEGVCPYHMIF